MVPAGCRSSGHVFRVGVASAQSAFPSKPVHIFVPYPAGGGVDVLTRTLGDVVAKQWGQSVVVENRPGAGGVIASQAVATSPPDGYTLIMVASGHATNPLLYPKIPYDTFKDFTPISLLASSPNILLVRADSPFKTLGDMIRRRGRSREACPLPMPVRDVDASGRRTSEESGQGRSQCRSLQGRAPAINDLLGGQIPMSFNNGRNRSGSSRPAPSRARRHHG